MDKICARCGKLIRGKWVKLKNTYYRDGKRVKVNGMSFVKSRDVRFVSEFEVLHKGCADAVRWNAVTYECLEKLKCAYCGEEIIVDRDEYCRTERTYFLKIDNLHVERGRYLNGDSVAVGADEPVHKVCLHLIEKSGLFYEKD